MKDPDIVVSNDDDHHTPKCPGCGARAERVGTHWQTIHDDECAWMLDPNSEPYS